VFEQMYNGDKEGSSSFSIYFSQMWLKWLAPQALALRRCGADRCREYYLFMAA